MFNTTIRTSEMMNLNMCMCCCMMNNFRWMEANMDHATVLGC
ncbi:MAG: hypothetical protein PUD20_01175 [bacterium]|nr:hypothetical protein [bacterium]